MPMLGTHSTYKKLAVKCSAETFVVNQTLVLRINICGEDRQLLVAANRVCLESIRKSGTNAVQKMEAL